MFEIRRYDDRRHDEWNAFVAQSKNGTFLFDRRYMDYHADRFADHSLMAYRNGRLYALLPAHREGDRLLSHGGLTYGGLITDAHTTAADTVVLFQELAELLRADGIRQVYYKVMPWIYHCLPAEEDLYALFRTGHARLVAQDIAYPTRSDGNACAAEPWRGHSKTASPWNKQTTSLPFGRYSPTI